MHRRAVWAALLFILLGVILGATVLRSDLARATGLAQSVTVANTGSNPVPVHEQKTVNVKVTNASLAVKPSAVTGGSFRLELPAGTSDHLPSAVTASAISMTMESVVVGLGLEYQGHEVAFFYGPAAHGHSPVDLALTRPIMFDEVVCSGTSGFCTFTAVGNQP
jgi:hypothetical protein